MRNRPKIRHMEKITFRGEQKTLEEWRREFGSKVDPGIVSERLAAGEDPLSALTRPVDQDRLTEGQIEHASRLLEPRPKRPYGRLITAWGETKSFTDWLADPRCKVRQRATAYRRLDDLGWSPEESLGTPARKMTPFSANLLRAFGYELTIKEWLESDMCVVGYGTLKNRLDHGWEPELALSEPSGEPAPPRVLEAFGERKRLADWANDPRCKVGPVTIMGRIKRGWTTEDAIGTPALELGAKKYSVCDTFRKATFEGETKRLRDWAKDPRCAVADFTFYMRLQRGWSFGRALMEPELEGGRLGVEAATHRVFEAFGESKRARDWAKDSRCRVSAPTLYERLERGWTMEDALTLGLFDPDHRGRARSKTVTAWDETKSLYDWMSDPRVTVRRGLIVERLRLGWPPEDAMTTPSGVKRRAA